MALYRTKAMKREAERVFGKPFLILKGITQTVSGKKSFTVEVSKQNPVDYAIVTRIGTGYKVSWRKTKAEAEDYAQKEARFMREEF